MARSFKPGIVVTMSASSLLACSGVTGRLGGGDGEGPPGNPPCCEDKVARFPVAPFTSGQNLEPRDAQDRPIQHASGTCWVTLPFEEPPTSWRPAPRQAVDCPPAMASDPAWGECNGGTLSLGTLSPTLTCTCYFDGNPPPSPKEVSCPVTSIPGLLTAASEASPPGQNPPATPPPTNPPIPEVPSRPGAG